MNVTYRLHGAEKRKYEIRYPYRITTIITIIIIVTTIQFTHSQIIRRKNQYA